jgi:hypothetical protein
MEEGCLIFHDDISQTIMTFYMFLYHLKALDGYKNT